MAYADIFKDESTFPDSIEVTLPNGQKATLGEIRDLTRTQQKSLAGEMERLTKEREEVKGLATQTADLYTKLQERDAAGPVKQAPPDDFDTDPWWEAPRKRFKAVDDDLKAIKEQNKALQATLERAALIFADQRWEGQFDRVKDRLKAPKYADWTFEKVRDYAANNKIFDKWGFPAMDKAVEAITREDELERIKQEAFEKGVREGSVKARLRATPRPTSASGGKPQASKGLDPTKNFEDLGDSIADDREVAEMVAGLQGMSPEDLLQ